MNSCELVVIGASAGGLEALLELIVELPADLPAAVIIVIHTRSDSSSYLPDILSRRTGLKVDFARHRAPIRPGHVYVAPPDFHLLVGGNRMTLGRGPKENGFRPAVDPLFRSAGRARGKRVIGVVLSGGLDDGTYGLATIKASGGVTVAQDPQEAIVAGMPQNAILHVKPDYVLGASEIGKLIVKLSGIPAGGKKRMAKRNDDEPQDPTETTEVLDMQQTFGPPTGLTCPDCGGALWEIKEGKLYRYRCHVGHQYSAEGLDGEQHQVVEGALWSAVRVLEEHAELRRRMAARASEANLKSVSVGFENSAADSQRQAAAIRALLFTRDTPEPPRPGDTDANGQRPAKKQASQAKTARTKRKRKSAR